MNWKTNEFLWLDWVVLALGVLAIVWAVVFLILPPLQQTGQKQL